MNTQSPSLHAATTYTRRLIHDFEQILDACGEINLDAYLKPVTKDQQINQAELFHQLKRLFIVTDETLDIEWSKSENVELEAADIAPQYHKVGAALLAISVAEAQSVPELPTVAVTEQLPRVLTQLQMPLQNTDISMVSRVLSELAHLVYYQTAVLGTVARVRRQIADSNVPQAGRNRSPIEPRLKQALSEGDIETAIATRNAMQQKLSKSRSWTASDLMWFEPDEFEAVVAELWRDQGHNAVRTEATSDYGIDVLVRLRDDTRGIQVKQYSRNNTIGVDRVQRLRGAIEHFDVDAGVLMTTSTFTESARKSGNRIEDIALINGETLLRTFGRSSIAPPITSFR